MSKISSDHSTLNWQMYSLLSFGYVNNLQVTSVKLSFSPVHGCIILDVSRLFYCFRIPSRLRWYQNKTSGLVNSYFRVTGVRLLHLTPFVCVCGGGGGWDPDGSRTVICVQSALNLTMTGLILNWAER